MKGLTQEQRLGDITSRLARYSAMAAAVAGSAGATQAAVVYTNVDPDVVLSNGTFDIDFDGNGSAEFQIFHYGISSTISGSGFSFNSIRIDDSNFNNGAAVYVTGGAYRARVLSSGATIDPYAGFNLAGNPWLMFRSNIIVPGGSYPNNYGAWLGASDMFLGVRMQLPSGVHFGWIRLSVNSNASEVTIKDFAYEDVPLAPIAAGAGSSLVCNSVDPPMNPRHTVNATSIRVEWDQVNLSEACQIQGERVVPPGPIANVNIIGMEPMFRDVPFAVAGAGTTWSWKVRCACSITPLVATPFSATDTFMVPLLREDKIEISQTIFPNPASDQVTLSASSPLERRTRISISDLSGREIDFILVPESTSSATIDVSDLAEGMYFVQVGEGKAVPLEVKH